jgi:uncharacterized protein (TIGR02145 family)
MKYLYKKQMKKLLILFLFLPPALVVVAQVPGTPYGLATLSPVTIPTGSGSFAGRTCFDVAQVNSGECGDLTSRQNETLTANGSRADFGDPITRNQTYTFTPSGTVSNVRFSYEEASPYEQQIIASLSGGNPGNNITSSTPVTCNIVYKSDLNGLASSTTNSTALKVDIYVVYNDKANGTGTDKSIKLTAMIKDCACCGAKTVDGGWLTFMCYNLGADPTLTTPEQIKNAPPSKTYGSIYQWGKKNAWPSTESVGGWTGGSKTAADPCPAGWRVPSQAQWGSIFNVGTTSSAPGTATANTWTWNGATTTRGYGVGFGLFLPAAGQLGDASGNIISAGESGRYWSCDGGGGPVTMLAFASSFVHVAGTGHSLSADAFSVRCVIE